MKKQLILFAVVILVFVPNVNSQTTKSRYLLSFSSNLFGSDIGSSIVNASYSWYEVEKNHNISSLKINPRLGYFLTGNFAGGLDLALSYSSRKYGTTNLSEVLYGAGPFVRFYTSPTKRFNPFIETNGTILVISSNNHLYGGGGVQENYFNVFGGMGVSYFIIENLAFELLGGYACYMRADKTSGNTYYNLNSLALKVGVCIVLGKKPNKYLAKGKL
jgi:hypothetical protein